MKRCPSCGASNSDSSGFCTSCGARLPASPNPGPGGYQGGRGAQPGYGPQGGRGPQGGYGPQGYGPRGGGYTPPPQPNYGSPNGYMIQPRSIVLAIILSIITCGIYGLYWMVKVNDELNTLAGNYNATSGILVIVLSICTCGIYGLYWSYKMGQNCGILNGDNGGGFLAVVLAFFGLQIINLAIFQDTINRYAC